MTEGQFSVLVNRLWGDLTVPYLDEFGIILALWRLVERKRGGAVNYPRLEISLPRKLQTYRLIRGALACQNHHFTHGA